ncbi:hypothetical protein GCM10029976_071420 [Kribbella albertanoniae]|uniref:Uncharacterized protein n=1 Tax=Kribbella albertanoniae TaxID=1266829 RepID=A0A4R4Q235_9ACTN|nr:hypothetical protein [Kribbella albertanoniae]TDC28833.1 hypothetical protein E1261_17295 [Kribbella albertanoniae]
MSLDELRRHLSDQADEIDLATPAPLAQVQRRATQVRRRRVATGVVSAAACLAAVGAVLTGTPVLERSEPATTPVPPPARVTSPPSDRMPTAPVKPATNDYVINGVRYQAEVAGAELQVAKISDRPISFIWFPNDTKVDFRVFCTIPGNASASGLGAVVLRINGKVITTRACDNVSDPLPGERFGAVLHENLGLRAGRAAELTATVVDGNGRELKSPGLLLGAAVYTRAETRAIDPPYNYVELPVVAQFHGRTYRLHDAIASPTSGPRYASIEIQGPEFEPYLAVFGVNGSSQAHSLELAGTPGGRSYDFTPADGPASGLYLAPVPAQAAGPVIFRQTQRQVSGELFLALYIPME